MINSWLLRQLGPGLLRHHVRRVPRGPVRVALPSALLVLAVGGLGTPKCACLLICGTERSGARVDAAGQPVRGFLREPPVAVRIAEGREGAVGVVTRRWPRDA